MTNKLGVAGAAVAALALITDVLLARVADTDDHFSGAGAVSEFLFAACLFGVAAVCVALVRRQTDLVSRAGAGIAVVGLVLSAVTAMTVPVRNAEPSETVSTVVILMALVGLVLLGAAVAARRIWPWWIGAVLAGFLLVGFFGGSPGGVVLAVAWTAVAFGLSRHTEPAPDQPVADPA